MNIFSCNNLFILHAFQHNLFTKESFQRALREVAPEMELFMENHGKYVKKFVIKLIYIVQSCTCRHFTKKLYLEEYVWKDIPSHFFCGNSLPNTTLQMRSEVRIAFFYQKFSGTKMFTHKIVMNVMGQKFHWDFCQWFLD